MSRNVSNRLIGNYGHIRYVFGHMLQRSNLQNSLSSNYILQWNQRASCISSAICREYSIRNSSLDSSSSTAPASSSSSLLPKINDLLNETKKLAPASRTVIDSGKSLFRRQWDAFFNWYDEISHTNEVREAHRQVEELQEKLNEAQNLRRDVSKELNVIRYDLQMCFADQANCQKGDPRYLELVRREIELSNKDKQKNEEFNLLDKAERDLFILMQSAVKTSHEKEKIHTNSAKYWSIVGSLAGALLGICGTAFSFYNRNDLLSDINKEFLVIRGDTKSINEQVQLLLAEQRDFLQMQQQQLLKQQQQQQQQQLQHDRTKSQQNSESWMHWIARQTYVISVYRYFVPKTVNS